ncbi:MAG: SDR family oxidoreductase [Deltaproteobacteria bacterium]|nr:SDR family oxidoreductase [Deltaproteobacteria bacterium]
MGRLEKRVSVVTGAGKGIGRGIARRFAREGARVLVAEIDAESGVRTAAEVESLGGEARFVRTDVAVKEQVQGAVQAAVDAWGAVHVLVNNAWGGGTIARLEWKTDAQMMHGVQTGFLSVFWAMQAAFPHMKAQGGGSIVNLCSLNGVNAHMYSAEYNTAKEAVRALTRTAAREWGRHQIRCNAICPAAATEAYEAFRKANPDTAAAMLRQNPMGRMGDPETDVAGVALFLATDDSAYLTGNTLFVDGGSHINGVTWAPELPEELPK